jgi:hypothetical protein
MTTSSELVKPTFNLPAGTYSYQLTVTDNDGLTNSDEVVIDIQEIIDTGFAIRINAGGGEVNAFGETFLEDQYFVGEDKTARNPNLTEILETEFDDLYLRERTTLRNDLTFGYEIPVPNGNYVVRLHFAEIWIGVITEGEVGKRVFDVTAEGSSVPEWSDIDIFARAGTATPLVIDAEVAVTDQSLSLNFASSSNRPVVSAIEVLGVSVSNSPPIANAGQDIVITADATGIASVSLDGSGSTDLDGTIVSYIWEENGTFTASGSNPTINLGIGSYTFDLTVQDDGGLTDSDQVNVTVNEQPAVSSSIRINAGGDETIAFNETFQEDSFFFGEGKPFRNTNLTDFPGNDDDLFLFERSATSNDAIMGYNIPVSNGTYLVRLHFAETWFGVTKEGSIGKRVFSVVAEGNAVPEWTNIDIIAQAGVLTPLVLEAEINVNDNSLDLEFTSSSNRSKINGIEVLELVLPAAAASDDDLFDSNDNFNTSFNFSPNPASHSIKVHLTGNYEAGEKVSLRILNMSGITVLEQVFEANVFDGSQIDISALKTGGYIIQIITNSYQSNRKFIKN